MLNLIYIFYVPYKKARNVYKKCATVHRMGKKATTKSKCNLLFELEVRMGRQNFKKRSIGFRMEKRREFRKTNRGARRRVNI